MHLIIPTSYRSQSSCTKFARKIGLPWPACPCANREVGGGDCESPLSPEKLARQEKVIASGFYREWEKEPNVYSEIHSITDIYSVECTVIIENIGRRVDSSSTPIFCRH